MSKGPNTWLARLTGYIVPDPSNHVQLFLVGIAGFFIVRSIIAALTRKGPERFSMDSVRNQPVPAKRNFTPRELSEFDGKDDSTPVYMSVKGIVYDVSASRHFYGPSGPYKNFAGRDASRGLAFNNFDTSVLSDLDGPVDKLEDLDKSEWASLDEWATFFAGKYPPVGNLVEPPALESKEESKEKSKEESKKDQ
ncbi:Dihydrodipicolinate synthase [Coemansia guatemalensis]|uniref:Dihydrodipicolinate synthase n=1 Tax=Coemansia guatemalensis TaxID=2761395 RepID=A0A9W8I0I9_9FUNG|nr:Dihydrodipicolinate synthase [Coemansia guatemalensis]